LPIHLERGSHDRVVRRAGGFSIRREYRKRLDHVAHGDRNGSLCFRGDTLLSSPAWDCRSRAESPDQCAIARAGYGRACWRLSFFCSARRSPRAARLPLRRGRAQRDPRHSPPRSSPSSVARTPSAQPARFECPTGSGYVSAEILHQPEPTNPLSFVVSAEREGVRPLSRWSAPRGLVGLVARRSTSTPASCSAGRIRNFAPPVASDQRRRHRRAAWAKPQRLAARAAGRAVPPASPAGTVIVTVGTGRRVPRGIPIGVVIGPAGEEKAGDARTWFGP